MLEIDEQTARKNVLFGLALFGVFVVLFAGTIAVALIYLAVAG
jgi:nitrogen fixation protein FixH